tara:strand:+ start:495 stop:1229 length:735 start_codon:yes stop_codon:yes gene_type:complete
MKIYLLTSNKYTKNLCPINVEFLNKYWPNQDVTIVGYEDVLELQDLPDNADVVCVGTQEDYGKTWTNALIPFFKEVKEEYFVLIFDDHILMNKVPIDKISELEEQFINKKAQKAMIGGGIKLENSNTFKENENLLEFSQHVDYRTSLHPAIWNKEYFLKYLRPNMTSWDFELHNENRARFDGAAILNYKYDYPNEPHLYSYLELYTKGKNNIQQHTDGTLLVPDQPSARFFDSEDITYIWEKTQ